MPGQVDTQAQLTAGNQFDGLTNLTGLFSFSQWDGFSRSVRVVLTAVSYGTDDAGDSGNIEFYLRPPVGATSQRILLGRGLQATITGPDGRADFSVCGKVVPRNRNGAHWVLHAVTTGKDTPASVVVDFVLVPYPDTSERDSAAP